MFYIKMGKYIFDENLRVIFELTPSAELEVGWRFQSLTKPDAATFLSRLWWETYAETHTSDEIASVTEAPPKELGSPESYDYKLRLILQMTLCKTDCKKPAPHKHVTQERRDMIIRERVPKSKTSLPHQ